MSLWRTLLGFIATAGLSWDPLKSQASVPDHGHPFGDLSIDPPSLVQLAEALGGGIYPGMGSGQNDHIMNQDSVAPGFPLQLFWLEPGNVVKRQAVKLSIQPSAYRTPLSGTTGAGDSHIHSHVHSFSTDTGHLHDRLDHKHKLATFQSTPVSGTNNAFVFFDAGGGNNPLNAINSASSDLWTAGVSGAGNTAGYTHAHSFVSDSTSEATHTHPVVSGFSNGTSPDNMGVMVDGVDVTSQLGGPWNTAQTELDVTPFVAPGTGFHLIQVTTATQVGRIYGIARLKSINNNLGRGA